MGVCNYSMFCCTLLYVHSSFEIILMGKKELAALLSLSSWCLVVVVWLFLAVPWICLRFVIVVFPDHTHLLFLKHYIALIVCRARFDQNVILHESNIGTGACSGLSNFKTLRRKTALLPHLEGSCFNIKFSY